jgi:hypothetical protein
MKSVELFNFSPGWVKLQTVYVDGGTDGELLQILDGTGYVKLQNKTCQRLEKKEGGAGYSGCHVRYFPERNQLQFWSQGGGKMGPAKMFTACGSK